jgi:UTP--glucose-1-phosphate uridylyltransferase
MIPPPKRFAPPSDTPTDPDHCCHDQAFDTEMQSFFYLFTRYLAERAKSQDLYVSLQVFLLCALIRLFTETGIASSLLLLIRSCHTLIYQSQRTARISTSSLFSRSTEVLAPQWVCVLLLIPSALLTIQAGMTGAKSALEVKDDMTFLDLTVRQIEHLNTTSRVDVPLILMTSFNTHEDTLRIIKKYANQQLRITTFNQSRYPRIFKETLLPCPKRADDNKKHWYPPGHGDLYNALLHSGVLDQLLSEGKEYLFVSNSDNLGAV